MGGGKGCRSPLRIVKKYGNWRHESSRIVVTIPGSFKEREKKTKDIFSYTEKHRYTFPNSLCYS